MIEFEITSGQIMAICAFVVSLWGIWKIIKEIRKPNEDLRAEVNKHATCLHNDNERLKEIESTDRMILQCMLVMLNHSITGNGLDKMKEVRNELQAYLISK